MQYYKGNPSNLPHVCIKFDLFPNGGHVMTSVWMHFFVASSSRLFTWWSLFDGGSDFPKKKWWQHCSILTYLNFSILNHLNFSILNYLKFSILNYLKCSILNYLNCSIQSIVKLLGFWAVNRYSPSGPKLKKPHRIDAKKPSGAWSGTPGIQWFVMVSQPTPPTRNKAKKGRMNHCFPLIRHISNPYFRWLKQHVEPFKLLDLLVWCFEKSEDMNPLLGQTMGCESTFLLRLRNTSGEFLLL